MNVYTLSDNEIAVLELITQHVFQHGVQDREFFWRMEIVGIPVTFSYIAEPNGEERLFTARWSLRMPYNGLGPTWSLHVPRGRRAAIDRFRTDLAMMRLGVE